MPAPARKLSPRPLTVRLAEDCLKEIGLASLKGRQLTGKTGTRIEISTELDRKNSKGFALFTRSRRAAERVLKEISISTPCPHSEPDSWVEVTADSVDAEAVLMACAGRIGIALIDSSKVDQAIDVLARRIQAGVDAMHGTAELKNHNRDYKQERLKRIEEGGPRMRTYSDWIIERVASTIQIGSDGEALFSRLFPTRTGT